MPQYDIRRKRGAIIMLFITIIMPLCYNNRISCGMVHVYNHHQFRVNSSFKKPSIILSSRNWNRFPGKLKGPTRNIVSCISSVSRNNLSPHFVYFQCIIDVLMVAEFRSNSHTFRSYLELGIVVNTVLSYL